MAVVWFDPTTNEAGGTIFLSGGEIHSMTTVSGLERHLTSRLNLPRRSKSSLTMYGQRLTAGGVSSYLPLLRTNIPRFVLWTRTLPLLIVPPSGKSAVVWVSPARDVAQLKLEVEAMLGIQPSYQRLVFIGRELRSKMSIASTGIQAYSAVRLKMRLRGGGGGFSKPKQSYGFADLGNNDLVKQFGLRSTTSGVADWRLVCYGLNIEGKAPMKNAMLTASRSLPSITLKHSTSRPTRLSVRFACPRSLPSLAAFTSANGALKACGMALGCT
ncbi:unnamed protein product [Aphanomyces euteiches]